MLNEERANQHCADRPFKSGNALIGTRCRASIAHKPQHLVQPTRNQRCFPRSDRNSVTRHGASVAKYQAGSQIVLMVALRLYKPYGAALKRDKAVPKWGHLKSNLAEIWDRFYR